MKTLSTVLREQGLTKRAEILEFIKNSELIRKSDNKKIDSSGVKFSWSDSNSSFNFGESNIYASAILVIEGSSIENFMEKLNRLDNRITEIEEEKQEIRNKINFLKEAGVEKYNENEYRAYKTIKIIEKTNLTDYEKAKIISELINKK